MAGCLYGKIPVTPEEYLHLCECDRKLKALTDIRDEQRASFEAKGFESAEDRIAREQKSWRYQFKRWVVGRLPFVRLNRWNNKPPNPKWALWLRNVKIFRIGDRFANSPFVHWMGA